MKEFRIFYIILIIISLVMSFLYLSRLMPVIFIILMVCPVFSLVILIINYFSISIKLSPGEIVTEKYEDGLITVTIKNRFIFPVTPIRLTGIFQGAGESGISKKILLANVSPLSVVTLNLPFSMPYRGEYQPCLEKAEMYDIFKLFKFSKKLILPVHIIVLPREFFLKNIKDINEADSENLRNVLSFHNKYNFSSLREYREGDSPRNIHWKLSAKQNELIVKQMEQSINNNSIIYCDFSKHCFDYIEKNNLEAESEDFNKKKRNARKKKIKKNDYSQRTGRKNKNVLYNSQNYHNDYPGSAEAFESILELTRHATDTVIEAALALTRRIISDNNSVKLYWMEGNEKEEFLTDDYNTFQTLFYRFSILPAGVSESSLPELLEFQSKDSGKSNIEHMIYIITHKLDRKLLIIMEELGFVVRNDVVLVLFDYIKNPPELLDYIINETKINIKLINDENINEMLSDNG